MKDVKYRKNRSIFPDEIRENPKKRHHQQFIDWNDSRGVRRACSNRTHMGEHHAGFAAI